MSEKLLAFHCDLNRAMWSEEFMAEYAATLARWGYNAILYDPGDKLFHRRHPAIAHADALTADETRTRAGVLRRHGLQVIPLVQTLGHAGYVLRNPGYERFCESPAHNDQYDPLSEDARKLILELVDETIDAVRPETFMHLGGDETWNLGRSETCRPLVEKIGVGGLYLQHMLPIVEHVTGRGLRPVLWADIALSHPGIIEKFPRDVVWMDWDYWSSGERWDGILVWELVPRRWHFSRWRYQEFREYVAAEAPEFCRFFERYAVDEQTRCDGTYIGFPYAAALRDMGFDVIVAPAARCTGDSMGVPFNDRHLPNCFAGARKGRDTGVGACVTSWSVRSNHPLLGLPGAFAASQGFGTEDEFNPVALNGSFTERRFGAAMPDFARAMRLAQVCVPWCRANEGKPSARVADAINDWLKQVDGRPGGRAGLIGDIRRSASDLAVAEALFEELRLQAHTNAADFDYWLEGTRHTAFCAAFSLALLRNRMPEEAPALIDRLGELREETRRLFSATFTAAGVECELAVRYAFLEAVLAGMSPGRHAPFSIGKSSAKLSSAERLRRAYFHEEMDRPAVYSRRGFPKDDPSYDELKACLDSRSDLKRRWSPDGLVSAADARTEHVREPHSEDFERHIRRMHTPGGVLEACTLESLKGQPGLNESFLIKTREDAEAWLSLPPPSIDGPVDPFFEAVSAMGERGIVEVALGMNPAGTVAELMGSERFAMASIEDRDMIHALCERRMQVLCDIVRYLVERKVGPFFSMLGEEYVVPPLHGARDFRDFNVRYDRPIVDIVHEAGGRVHIHCHGRLRAVFKEFLEIGVDVLHPVEPPPMGDLATAEARALAGDRLCIEGNLQIASMYEERPREVRAQTAQLISDAFTNRRGLIVSPSASPYIRGAGAQCFPRYMAMIEAVEAWSP